VVVIGESFDEVLRAARSGSEWAYRVLYRELNPPLLRYFLSQAPGAAEDLAADTWVGVAKGLRRFSGDERAWRAWVFKIGQRRLVDHWAITARRRRLMGSTDTVDEPADATDVEAVVIAQDSVWRALRVLRRTLSEDQARIVMLRIVGGLSVEQVAVVLGKRANTVRVVQHTALKKLARLDALVEELTP
jgi:RNA polymerase sigma-70 factor (ECF subfamily)